MKKIYCIALLFTVQTYAQNFKEELSNKICDCLSNIEEKTLVSFHSCFIESAAHFPADLKKMNEGSSSLEESEMRGR